MNYDDALDAARTDLGLLNADELEVARYFISKIIRGKAKHGPLDLDTDTRDWLAESVEERVDDAAYSIMSLVQRNRRAPWSTAPLTIDDVNVEEAELDLDVAEAAR